MRPALLSLLISVAVAAKVGTSVDQASISRATSTRNEAAEMMERLDTAGVRSKPFISVADVVREVVIGDPFSTSWDDWARREHVSAPSADSQYVAVVVRRGDVDRGANVGTLLVYETAELLQSSTPRKVAEFASRTNRQPLALVRWLADNQTLIFAATDGKEPTQVYRVDIGTSDIERLTKEQTPIEWYDIADNGWRLVATVRAPAVRPEQDSTCTERGCLVTSRTLFAAQSGEDERSGVLNVYNLKTGERSTPARLEMMDPDIDVCHDELKGGLSPDGRFGVRSCILKVGHWPKWWADYDVDPQLAQYLARANAFYALRLVITDFQTGASRTLTQAPFIWDQPPPIWIDGGRHLLVAGTLETLADTTPAEISRRKSTKAVLLFDPITGRSERIAVLPAEATAVTRSTWDQGTETLTLEITNSAEEPLESVAYRRLGKSWAVAPPEERIPPAAQRGGPRLVLRESLNEPPVLNAIDPATGAETVVLNPNPWLAERRLGRVEKIAWTLKDGQTWRGGLYYPPDYRPGVRYPLVILTHGFNDDRFSLSGYARNFAAQPLAAHGMLVLQVEEKLRSVVGTPKEWPTVQAGYEGAIDHLDEFGLIDRNRVGMQGWSRTGPHVGYMLTHSPYPIAAAALTSTADFGWWYYLAAGTPPELEADYGAAPFGGGLDVWRKLSPSFNLDRVQAPTLMWSDQTVAGLWDWYAGLKRLNKPVEYWFLPEGTHDVFKVGERMLTNELLVDWFRFWLKDEEDSDPAKADQYQRWRELRRQRDAVPKEPPLQRLK